MPPVRGMGRWSAGWPGHSKAVPRMAWGEAAIGGALDDGLGHRLRLCRQLPHTGGTPVPLNLDGVGAKPQAAL